MSRNFDFSQAANHGITVLPDLTVMPNPSDLLVVKTITAGVVDLGFASAAAASGAAATIADTPPAGAAVSSLWWDSTGTGLYIRYNDGNSTQWVSVENQAAIGTVKIADNPPTAADNSLWWDSGGTGLYVRYNDGNSTQWVAAQNPYTLTDAPNDGHLYARQSAHWVDIGAGAYLPLTGGTVTGKLQVASHITSTTAGDNTHFVNMTAVGSGTNGPAGAQFGQKISAYKDNWLTTTTVGEIDGLQIIARQGGPGSDCGAIVADVQNTGTGFLAGHEYSVASINSNTSAVTQWIDSQEAALNGPGGAYYGHVYTALAGALTTGILIQTQNAGSSWGNFLQCIQGGAVKFTVDGNGAITAAGGMTIDGDVTLAGPAGTTLYVVSDTTIGTTLYVGGTATFAGPGTGLQVSNNATVGGAFAVTGNATISGDVTLAGPAGTALYVENDTTIGTTLYVGGTGTFAGPGTGLQVSNNLNANSIGVSTTLFVAGGSTLAGNVGFHGTAPVAKPTVTGAKGSNAALASLIAALAAYGLVTDSTSA
jgi:hypothetical protein